jgi:hypothetical protein
METSRDPDPAPAAADDELDAPFRSLVVHPWRVLGQVMLLCLLASALLAVASWLLDTSSHVRAEPGPLIELSAALRGPEPGSPKAERARADGLPTSGWLLPTVTLEPEPRWRAILGTARVEPARPSLGSSVIAMERAQRNAVAVARQLHTGTKPETQVFVIAVAQGSPADVAGVRPGDLLLEADGREIDLATSPVNGVTWGLERRGERMEARLEHSGGVELLEVAVAQPWRFELDGVGGGSGGLMMTLAALDHLEPASRLHGGRLVAGTGTIHPDGRIGPVVGVAAKLHAAADAGAKVFFVPSSVRLASSELPTGVEVVPVTTVEDALAWLCASGGSHRVCG